MTRVAHLLLSLFLCSVLSTTAACPTGSTTVRFGDDGGSGGLSVNGVACEDTVTVTEIDLTDENDEGTYSCRLETPCEGGEQLIIDCSAEAEGGAEDDPALQSFSCRCTIGGGSETFRDVGLCAATEEARARRAKDGCADAF